MVHFIIVIHCHYCITLITFDWMKSVLIVYITNFV